jgi:hypothetical protein
MLVLLLAGALIALTILALLLLGVVAAIVTGIVLLNLAALALALRPRRAAHGRDSGEREGRSERWRPSSFRRLPEQPLAPPLESDEPAHPLTVHRR